jgi:hypothetical protein
MTHLMLDKFRKEDGHYIMTTFIPPAYLPCTKALNELEKIKVNELQLEIHHFSDILWLSKTDGRVPAKFRPAILEISKRALEWKEEGDVAMKKKKHWDAIEW